MMAVAAKDRPLEVVKEEVIDQLILNYSHGELSSDAFERRLDSAYECDDQQQLVALVADLPLQSDPRYQSEKAARLRPQYTQSSQDDKDLSITTVLSSDHRSGDWVVPQVIHLKNVLGSAELDFSNAIFTHPEVHVHLNCLLGSNEIFVPHNVDVLTQTTNIIGSVTNKRVSLGPRTTDTQRPKIIIHGRVVLGSLEISVKRTMKEKLKTFAQSMRALFDDGSHDHDHNKYY
ncbi:LiaF domain-containing protein [Pseudoalteromonas sp. SSDWG2]|uniref:LiaF domain-containing protein n=1 Tax=Pseudoalteromonas sp. SSDWG2 TaxID=3139391 RepID=UPI003BACCCEE